MQTGASPLTGGPNISDPAYAHADQHAIAFHPGYNGTTNRIMFVGNDGGVFRTDNARAAVATGPLAACDPPERLRHLDRSSTTTTG